VAGNPAARSERGGVGMPTWLVVVLVVLLVLALFGGFGYTRR
jgi:hypothetical protein